MNALRLVINTPPSVMNIRRHEINTPRPEIISQHPEINTHHFEIISRPSEINSHYSLLITHSRILTALACVPQVSHSILLACKANAKAHFHSLLFISNCLFFPGSIDDLQ
jgi:hypothetical protein